MIDKIGSCLALNFELGQFFLQTSFWQQNIHRRSYFRFIVRLHFVNFWGVFYIFEANKVFRTLVGLPKSYL